MSKVGFSGLVTAPFRSLAGDLG